MKMKHRYRRYTLKLTKENIRRTFNMHFKFSLQISSVDTPKVQIFVDYFPCSMSRFLALDLPCLNAVSLRRSFDNHNAATDNTAHYQLPLHCW